jgi:uncharacterized protein (DUF1330 family)
MNAYYLFDVRAVHDPERLASYRAAVLATVQAYGGRYLLAGANTEILEGTWRPSVPVLIEFPSLERAKAWFESSAYEPLKALRRSASDCNAVLLEATPSELIA